MEERTTDNYIKASRAAKQLAHYIIEDESIQNEELFDFLEDNSNRESIIRSADPNSDFFHIIDEVSRHDVIGSGEKLHHKLIAMRREKQRQRFKKLSVSVVAIVAVILISLVIKYDYFSSESQLLIIESSCNKSLLEPTLVVESESGCYDVKLDVNVSNVYYVKNVTDTVNTELVYNTLIVPSGFTYTVVLSDSSSVTVNAGGELKYPVDFGEESRRVELKGEAFFNVSKSSKPFIVNMGESQIMVYGTEFNIKYNRATCDVETVLITGTVGFRNIYVDEITLTPNQKINYNNNSKSTKVETVDVDEHIAWKDGSFRYVDKPLTVILQDISSWYGVQFITKSDLQDEIVTINILKTNTVDDVIKFLSKMIEQKIIKTKTGVYEIE